jgi:hypothetical protein
MFDVSTALSVQTRGDEKVAELSMNLPAVAADVRRLNLLGPN